MCGSNSMEKSERRERLLEKHRFINVEWSGWWDSVYEEFTEDMAEKGIEVTAMYFSGFWTQGDGACFEGSLIDTKKYLDAHCKPEEYPWLRKLIEKEGTASVSCAHQGRYYHENCTSFSVEVERFEDVMDTPTDFHELIAEEWDRQLDNELDGFEELITETWRSYMQDLYRSLEEEYDNLTSDEAVWDTIEANELDKEDDEDDYEVAA